VIGGRVMGSADRSHDGAAGSQPSAPAGATFGERLQSLEAHLAARVFTAEGHRGAVQVAVDGRARIHAVTLEPDWARTIRAQTLDSEVARLYRSASRAAVAAAESLYTGDEDTQDPPVRSSAEAVVYADPDSARAAGADHLDLDDDMYGEDMYGEDMYGEEPDLPDLGIVLTDQDFVDLATAGLAYAGRDTGADAADLHDDGVHAAAMGGLPAASEVGQLVDFPWVAEAFPALRHVMAKLAAETVRTGDIRTGVAVEFTCEGELIDIEMHPRYAAETEEGRLAEELVRTLRAGEDAAAQRRSELAAEITGDRPLEEVAQEQLAQLRERMDQLRERLP
jgi:DNA-binding protein YbaB